MKKALDKCRHHEYTKWARYSALGLMLALTAVMVLITIWLVRPYNDVRFGAPVSTILTPVVQQGGNVVVENPSFCVDDVDTTVERWADYINPEGRVVASYEMFTLQFFGKGKGLVCSSPATITVTLPNYVTGVNAGNGTFRLRQVITYRPNPVRTVSVDLLTDPFLVIATKGPKHD